MKRVSGHITVSGKISFAAQDPWIFPGTVKDNILFGSTFDMERYLEVISVCGLAHDIEQWKNGDETKVGDRGAKLSGGQKVTKKSDI